MNSSFLPKALPVLCALFVVSCGDDPELVEKRDKQAVEISDLKGKVAMLQEKISKLPEDPKRELAEAQAMEKSQSEEIDALTKTIADLSARKLELEGELSSYRAKYKAE